MTALNFDVFWRDHGASAGLKKLAADADKAGNTYKQLGVKAAAAGLIIAAGAIKFGAASVKAYGQAEAAQAKLQNAFKKFPALADTNIGALRSLNSQLALKTKYDDDATASGQAVLAQFKLTGTQITQLTPLLQDYATRTGKDLPAAATVLGKAVMGQGRALKQVGINFKDTGDAGQNFEQIMTGLRQQVGGFATQEGQTAAGKLAILKNQFGELEEAVGAKLVPSLTKGVSALTSFIGFVDANKAVVGPLAAGIASVGLATAGLVAGVKGVTAVKTALQTLSITAKGASLAIAGIGAAVGVATLIWGQYATKQAEAKGRIQELTDALNQQKSGIAGATQAALAKQLQDRGALNDAQQLGIAYSDVTAAILGNADARSRVMAATDGNKAASLAEADAMVRLRHEIGTSTGELGKAKNAQDQMAGATANAGDAAEQAKQQQDAYAASLAASARAALGASNAAIGYEQAVDDATKAAKDNGKTLDINTAKGRANRTALNQLAAAGLANVAALKEQNASTKRVDAANASARAAFIRTALAMGKSKEEARRLATQYGLLPKKKETKVSAPGATQAKREADAVRRAIGTIPGQKNIYIHAYWTGSRAVAQARQAAGRGLTAVAYGGLVTPNGILRRAGGGSVPGYSPHSRADNIPAMLTAGEYVQPVSSVRKYGEGAMNAIRTGRARVSFASGGMVGGSVGGGGNTYVINAPHYVGSTNDLRRALVDMARRGELEVIRR